MEKLGNYPSSWVWKGHEVDRSDVCVYVCVCVDLSAKNVIICFHDRCSHADDLHVSHVAGIASSGGHFDLKDKTT